MALKPVSREISDPAKCMTWNITLRMSRWCEISDFASQKVRLTPGLQVETFSYKQNLSWNNIVLTAISLSNWQWSYIDKLNWNFSIFWIGPCTVILLEQFVKLLLRLTARLKIEIIPFSQQRFLMLVKVFFHCNSQRVLGNAGPPPAQIFWGA